jgi:hypothetical protein
MFDSYQKIYRFPNGYGSSVVSGPNTYGGNDGLFEVAVLDNNGEITYNTPITADVLGWLDFDGVAKILNKIKAL